jgi:transposase
VAKVPLLRMEIVKRSDDLVEHQPRPRRGLGSQLRPRKTDMRAAMNAILYLLRTGCPLRYLPCDGFPPRSTVYNIFRKFQHEGVWEAIWAELHMALRERSGAQSQPLGCGSR